ncbi:MAG: M20/M25/M40 family metallo-hydrolase [Acidobacteriota bacterium]|nr:M20/M25/M40 family metallo-hydrolase [Acidobacteriota bacterium]MDH3521966.1 M20/M25/M40 family metallo-hydrolase [Acidobacteriota bacterium]
MRRSRALAGGPLLLLLLLACRAERPAAPAPLSEAAGWLQAYLRLDTTNPPGGERAAAELLAGVLAEAGVDHELLDAGDGRPSLWAFLPPTEPAAGAQTLLMLHHMDVVPAGPSWRAPPFGGEVREGELWGRGAIDAKSLGVAQLAALVALAREGGPRRRGVALFAAADEERGGRLGVERWLTLRPELLDGVAAVVNEGGSNRGFGGRLHWWGIEVAQKRPLWIEATAGDPAALVAGLRRLVDLPPSWRVSPAVRFTFGELAPHYNDHWRAIFLDLDRFVLPGGPTVQLLPGMATFFLDSLQANELEVLPDGRGRARIDVRLLPDSDAGAWLPRIRGLLGPAIEVEVLLSAPAVEASPWDGPWVGALTRVLGPVAPVVPQMGAGITDSRFFRERGVPAYGLSPFILDGELMRTIHGRDERIPLAELERGTARMTELVALWARGAH